MDVDRFKRLPLMGILRGIKEEELEPVFSAAYSIEKIISQKDLKRLFDLPESQFMDLIVRTGLNAWQF